MKIHYNFVQRTSQKYRESIWVSIKSKGKNKMSMRSKKGTFEIHFLNPIVSKKQI